MNCPYDHGTTAKTLKAIETGRARPMSHRSRKLRRDETLALLVATLGLAATRRVIDAAIRRAGVANVAASLNIPDVAAYAVALDSFPADDVI